MDAAVEGIYIGRPSDALTEHFPGAIACKFRHTGQTCICANRIFVQSNVYDEFASKLSAKVEGFVVGDGLHENTSVDVTAALTSIYHVVPSLARTARSSMTAP